MLTDTCCLFCCEINEHPSTRRSMGKPEFSVSISPPERLQRLRSPARARHAACSIAPSLARRCVGRAQRGQCRTNRIESYQYNSEGRNAAGKEIRKYDRSTKYERNTIDRTSYFDFGHWRVEGETSIDRFSFFDEKNMSSYFDRVSADAFHNPMAAPSR